jgi:HAD superfamily hydrolase (TIGR01509 family)
MAQVLMHERLRGFQPFEDAVEALMRLSGEHLLGVITNGQTDMQRATLAALGLQHYFKVIVVSGEIGAGKPSVEIFAEAARQAGVGLDEAAHVGDSLANDVGGAKAAGMLAVWLNRSRRALQHHEPRPTTRQPPLARWLRSSFGRERTNYVIPAEAGIQRRFARAGGPSWAPAGVYLE